MGEGLLNKPIAKTVANTVAKYRTNLSQLADKIFLTDGGMETTLIFHEGVDLPLFASFDLLKSNEGIERTRAYYARYCKLARDARRLFEIQQAALLGPARGNGRLHGQQPGGTPAAG